MRVFLQGLNNSQRYHFENLTKIKQKRLLSITSATLTVSIKNKAVAVAVSSRSTSVVFVVFKQAVVVAAISVYNPSLTCWHCDKPNHKKPNCFDLNQPIVARVHKLIDESNKKIKKTHKHVAESKKA